MAKIALDLTQFKSAGIYTVEIDNIERISVTTQSLRLVPGFSAVGPFNTPVFIRSNRDLEKFFGPLDSKLERKGSFFHRSIGTCLLTSPVFAISLLYTDDATTGGIDNVDFIGLELESNASDVSARQDLYVNLFNRQRFWIPDTDYLQSAVVNKYGLPDIYSAPLLQIANVGTKTLSFIVRKAQNLLQYKVYAQDWYAGNIPYNWIRPYDYLSDYFIQVVAVEGDWTNYGRLATDPYYSQFFNANGMIPAQLNNFMNSPQINLVGSWVGTIIPDFVDKTGVEQYIESIINANTPISGVMVNVNQEAMDQMTWDTSAWFNIEASSGLPIAAPHIVDLVGHSLVDLTGAHTSFLSYDISVADAVLHDSVTLTAYPAGDLTNRRFSLTIADGAKLTVGTLIEKQVVSGVIPGLTYVTEKYYDFTDDVYVIHTAESVAPGAGRTVQKTIDDASIASCYKVIPLTGLTLTNKHLPGFATTGAASAEAGVEKIYGMLEDSGIERGLVNKDMISYRYIVDTMAFGLGEDMGGKKYLSSLAKKRGKCTAILNAPAISQFVQSQDPYFCETFATGEAIPIFDVKWIPEGGNPDMPRSFRFTLPNEEYGSKFCGVFGPFLKYNENGRTMNVPPAADVANAYVKKFLGGNPFAIVANRNGILVNPNLIGVEYPIDKSDRDYLEPFGFNSIIDRPASGEVLIYANATAYQGIKSEFNNLHVREILNTIEIQVEEVLEQYIFDFNNPVTRLNILNSITPILETMKDAGALTKYEVVMDETNNPPELIAEGFGIIDINVWIMYGLTKIVNRITVNSNSGISTGGFVF
jgi:hypothetical protein